MNVNIETAADSGEASIETQQEFTKLVLGLVNSGQKVYDNSGAKDRREKEYLLPDGRTMKVYQLLNKEYDTGAEVVLSESAINSDGKPYTLEHVYCVFDYGGTVQYLRVDDEYSAERKSFHHSLEMTEEEKAEEKRLKLDRESQKRAWELEGIATRAGIEIISEAELMQLITELRNLRKSNNLEELPPKIYGRPVVKLKAKQEINIYEPIEGAVKAAKSLIYQKELKSTEPAHAETIGELEKLAIEMAEKGEVVFDESDYEGETKPPYKSSHHRLVNDDEVEVREYLHIRDPDDTKVIIIISSRKPDGLGELHTIEKWYFLAKNGDLQLDLRLPSNGAEDEELENDQDEDEEAAENRRAGLKMGIDMGLHKLSQTELSSLIELLKTAEPLGAQ